MMALWMVYALAVSLLLGAAALAAEKALDLYGKPTRWPWVAAMVGSVALPAAAYVAAAGWLEPVTGAGAAAAGTGRGLTAVPLPGDALAGAGGAAAGTVQGLLPALDPWLVGGCVAASLAVAGWLLAGWVRLRASRRRWRSRTIDDVPVFISPDEGPAVAGFLRGVILLPEWFDELDGDLQQLVLRHEREHLTSGDHRLFAVALATVVAMPWNPLVWWGLSRLRQATEIDCDRRVVSQGASRATYGELLVRAGRRRASGPPLSPAAFADSKSLLERRIRRLATSVPEARGAKAAAAVAVVVAAAVAGGWMPAPAETVTMTPASAGAPGTSAARPAAAGPAAMRLDLRLYARPGGPGAEAGSGDPELDLRAVRLARRLAYGCAPYMDGTSATGGAVPGPSAGSSPAARPGGPGCLVVLDGERVDPAVLRELGPGSIERIEMLPADAATERFGPDGREGAYLLRTKQG